MTYLNSAKLQIADLPLKVAREHENYIESSLSSQDGVADPYDQAIEDLNFLIDAAKFAITQINNLKTHIHQYGSNDYCIVCGADGRR